MTETRKSRIGGPNLDHPPTKNSFFCLILQLFQENPGRHLRKRPKLPQRKLVPREKRKRPPRTPTQKLLRKSPGPGRHLRKSPKLPKRNLLCGYSSTVVIQCTPCTVVCKLWYGILYSTLCNVVMIPR